MKLLKTTIHHKVLIRVPREQVYAAMTTPEGLDAWFTNGTVKEKGKLHLRWKNWGPDKVTTESENSPILEDNPPERFVFKWWMDTPNPTTVEMDFLEHKEGTLLKLKEFGYEDTEEGHNRFEECAVGWGEALTLLKFYCEYGLTY